MLASGSSCKLNVSLEETLSSGLAKVKVDAIPSGKTLYIEDGENYWIFNTEEKLGYVFRCKALPYNDWNQRFSVDTFGNEMAKTIQHLESSGIVKFESTSKDPDGFFDIWYYVKINPELSIESAISFLTALEHGLESQTKLTLNKEVQIDIETLHSLEDEEILQALVNMGEGKKIEFKLKIPPSRIFASIISAFGNTEGGLLLIGIHNSQNVQGLSVKDQKKFQSYLQQAIAKMDHVPLSMSWGLLNLQGKKIGAVLIWPESRHFVVEGSILSRVGTTNLRLKENEYKKIKEQKEDIVPLKLSDIELKQFMKVCDKEAFTELLLVPLMRQIGFRSVQRKGHREKILEFGQDLRCFKFELPTGNLIYFAAQVKKEDLGYSPIESSSTVNVERVLTQIMMALDHEMFDNELNSMFLPDHVLLIALGDVNEGARQYISENLSRTKQRRVLFWFGESITEKVSKFGLSEGNQIAIKAYTEEKIAQNKLR